MNAGRFLEYLENIIVFRRRLETAIVIEKVDFSVSRCMQRRQPEYF
jgi:hypothetical protein